MTGGQSFISPPNESKIHIMEDYLFCENKDSKNKENELGQENMSNSMIRSKMGKQAKHYVDYYL